MDHKSFRFVVCVDVLGDSLDGAYRNLREVMGPVDALSADEYRVIAIDALPPGIGDPLKLDDWRELKCPHCGAGAEMGFRWFEPVEEIRDVTLSKHGLRVDYTGQHTDADGQDGYLGCRNCGQKIDIAPGIAIGWDEDPPAPLDSNP